MAYEKQIWEDRVVQNPMTYNMQTNDDGTITLIPAPGTVTKEGNLITAERMNHMEDGIAQINNLQGVIKSSDFALITTQVTTPEANNDALSASTNVDYPDGFTKDTCIVVGLMGNNPEKNQYWSTFIESGSSLGYIGGVGGLRAILFDDHIVVQRTKSTTTEPSSTSNIKVVLMKLPSNE